MYPANLKKWFFVFYNADAGQGSLQQKGQEDNFQSIY